MIFLDKNFQENKYTRQYNNIKARLDSFHFVMLTSEINFAQTKKFSFKYGNSL